MNNLFNYNHTPYCSNNGTNVDCVAVLKSCITDYEKNEEINEMDGQDKFESVSAHFGEAPNDNSTLKLEQLRTILKKGLANRIGHCAALWCVNSSTFAEKIELVRVIKELQTVIEICPSSTSILFKSPTIDREIINLLGTSIVIGSDNPGLFNTDLRNEIRIFESFLSSPKSENVFEI